MRAHSELLLRDSSRLPDDLAERLNFVTDGAKSIDRFVDALSRYSSALQTGSGEFLPTKTDVMLRNAIAKLAEPIKEHAAEVTYGDLPRVKGNADRLVQLFEQLLRNALEHRGADPPRIQVTAAKEAGEEWTFTVRDNGPGIEEEELERVFRPFERLHGKGAGLGLATARAIVEGHGGRIWAEAPADGGASIRFTLPA
jgi:signal transduction histidine kinase